MKKELTELDIHRAGKFLATIWRVTASLVNEYEDKNDPREKLLRESERDDLIDDATDLASGAFWLVCMVRNHPHAKLAIHEHLIREIAAMAIHVLDFTKPLDWDDSKDGLWALRCANGWTEGVPSTLPEPQEPQESKDDHKSFQESRYSDPMGKPK